MRALAGFVLLSAGVFGLYAVVFMYAVEDAFFDAMLEQEAAAQLIQHARSGHWAAPRDANVQLVATVDALPDDIGRQLRREPERREFAGGAGRHYHLHAIDPPAPATRVWLVAEVSGQLVVRPIRNRVLWLFAASGLLLVAAALLAAWWLARRTVRPLAQLTSRVGAMSPEHLPETFAIDGVDPDIDPLARGLDALADRVRAFVERERAFTRDASHELRTPLTVIRGAAERLSREPALTDDGRRRIADIGQSALQLEQTIRVLLALAREEVAPDVAASQRLLPMIERVIVEQSPRLDGREMPLALRVPADASATLPAGVLWTLLANLIGNAFAHGGPRGVRMDVAEGRLRIANDDVHDGTAGRWPSPQPFDRGDGSRGEGLGLSILRRLGDRHGVDLRIERVDGWTVASLPVDAGGQGAG